MWGGDAWFCSRYGVKMVSLVGELCPRLMIVSIARPSYGNEASCIICGYVYLDGLVLIEVYDPHDTRLLHSVS